MKLVDHELLERAKWIGQKHDELIQHRGEADALKKRLKVKEDQIAEDISKLAHQLFTGHEPRETTVEAWANFATGKFEEIRTDTMAVVYKRPLEADEKQGAFDMDDWKEQLHLRLVREDELRRERKEVDDDDQKN